MSEFSNENLKRLLGATAHGDSKAFEALYDETSPRLHAVALTLMRDAELAEDVLQDAFVQIWHRAGEFHADRGSVFTWLTTIVRYRAIDMLRRRGRDASAAGTNAVDVEQTEFDYLQGQDAAGDSNQSQAGPLALAIASEENSLLRDCIDRLSNNQQRSIALAFFRGFTHQELADCLAEHLGTIKSRLRRSLLRLKDCLESIGNGNAVRPGTG